MDMIFKNVEDFKKILKEGYFISMEVLSEPEDPGVEGDTWKGYSIYRDIDGRLYKRFWSSDGICCLITGEFKKCSECENRFPDPMRRLCKKSTLLELPDGKIIEVVPVE
jgi:hypothetical protein